MSCQAEDQFNPEEKFTTGETFNPEQEFDSEDSDPGEPFDLDEWYNSGKPIFTKEAMRQAALQLPICKANERLSEKPNFDKKISLLTLQGTLIMCPITEFRVEEGDNPEEEYVWTPVLAYQYYAHLLQEVKYRTWPSNKLCSMAVCLMRDDDPRSKTTKIRIARPPDLREEPAAERFQQVLKQWQGSEAWNTIKNLLRANFSHRVDNLILFAGGRFSMGEGESKGENAVSRAKRCAVQHAMPLLIRNVLKDLNLADESTDCYAQDPIYTDVDIAVLKQNGVTVLDDPEGFLKVDSTSCVISFQPAICVDQITLDIARPALLIFTHDDDFDEEHKHLFSRPVFKIVEEILEEEYYSFAIGQHEAFGPVPVTIFVRKV